MELAQQILGDFLNGAVMTERGTRKDHSNQNEYLPIDTT
jgi:hypothetical protein